MYDQPQINDEMVEAARSTHIVDMLSMRGYSPNRKGGRNMFYRSPLRNENDPSFAVYMSKNFWFDFGSGESGDVIDLEMKISNCSFQKAVANLIEMDLHNSPGLEVQTFKESKGPGLEIISNSADFPLHLIRYAELRGIKKETLSKWCRYVKFKINDSHYKGIGIQNCLGAWEIRNEWFKGSSSPKAPIWIDRGGDDCVVVEGFFDFLSLEEMFEGNDDVCILNSVNMVDQTVEKLSTYRRTEGMLDRDKAGDKATKYYEDRLDNFVDCRAVFEPFEDLNEMLKSQLK